MKRIWVDEQDVLAFTDEDKEQIQDLKYKASLVAYVPEAKPETRIDDKSWESWHDKDR